MRCNNYMLNNNIKKLLLKLSEEMSSPFGFSITDLNERLVLIKKLFPKLLCDVIIICYFILLCDVMAFPFLILMNIWF
jgi:hypothetical protein